MIKTKKQLDVSKMLGFKLATRAKPLSGAKSGKKPANKSKNRATDPSRVRIGAKTGVKT